MVATSSPIGPPASLIAWSSAICVSGRGIADDHTQRAGFEHPGDLLEGGIVRLDQDPGRGDTCLGEHFLRRDLRWLGDNHEPAASPQRLHDRSGLSPEPTRSSTASMSAATCSNRRGPVVDQMVDAQVAQPLVLARRARAPHLSAAGLGDLDREMADTAGRGVDQQPVPPATLPPGERLLRPPGVVPVRAAPRLNDHGR